MIVDTLENEDIMEQDETIKEMAKLYQEGRTLAQLSKDYGVSYSTIKRRIAGLATMRKPGRKLLMIKKREDNDARSQKESQKES